MSFLQKILDVKKEEVAELHRNFTRESFRSSEMFGERRLSLESALSDKTKINIIAEVKKASPSKGILKNDFDHAAIAKSYMKCGADAISVLTDKQFFQGNISFLRDIGNIKTVPLLRKDFIIDEFQILEAKATGADAILLIAEALSAQQINELTIVAEENDLEVLLELHSEKQLDKIDFTRNKIIGINNRDLETFKVDISTTAKIAKQIPSDTSVVSESGISSKQAIEQLKKLKVDAVLVGEHFMRSDDLDKSLKEFVGWCKHES
ncbi:MAG: indole-3-glycerol phosphate synthase TrpC [Bacteroidetes bacterium]|nr:indole-3-glycerol phosphate synthase TrpC [Bacteroidota bacterium]